MTKMNYTQRFYEGETDYTAMRRLIADSYKLAAPHSYMLLGDLDWWRALLPEPAAFLPTIPLWFAGDTLVGFVWPRRGSSEILFAPAPCALPNLTCWPTPSSTCAHLPPQRSRPR